jgi:hypothetical protein
MPNLLTFSILSVVIMTPASAVAEPILVLVHDYANVDATLLKGAKRSASRVLATAGVQVRWVDCPESPQAPKQCQDPPDPSILVLHILPAGVTRRAVLSGALGFAVPPEPGQFGSFAGVFYDRVERISSHGYSDRVILGHAIAHEIGHLLLGVGGHSESGLMKPEWHRKELEQAVNGILVFDGVQRARIMQNLKARGLVRMQGMGR